MNKFDLIYNTVLSILSEDKQKSWAFNLLHKELAKRLPAHNATRSGVRYMLRTMVKTGVILGKLTGSDGVPTDMRYAEPDNQFSREKKGEEGGERTYSTKEFKWAVQEEHKRMLTERQRADELARRLKSTEQLLQEAREDQTEVIIEVQVNRGKKQVRSMKELFHAEFGRLIDLVEARMNILIWGPTGSGKTYLCEQLARANDLRFAYVSCTSGMAESVLLGRLLPTGKGGQFEYSISEFIDCFENGGLFLLDEFDAADPNVLLVVNSALANGIISLPSRIAKPYAERHPDFVCVAAANTVGTNADRLYAGRNKLDGSTLDRFQIGKVYVDYDPKVEAALCPDSQLLNTCHAIRKAINSHQLERAMSTRFIEQAYKMRTQFDWTDEMIFDKTFFIGWREDEINKVKNEAQHHGAVFATA